MGKILNMKNKKHTFMTQTIQSLSWTSLNGTEKDLNINKSEAEDNMRLLLRLYDSLNALCEKLSRLDYVIQRKSIELLLIYQKYKGEIQ
jgi:hypothetical protein